MLQPNNDIEVPQGVNLVDYNDYGTIRGNILKRVRKSIRKAFPISYGGVRMEVEDVDYEDDKPFTLNDQKDALLKDKYLTKKLRGTVRITDEATNTVIEEKPLSLMRVPWLTDRGSFIHGGNEYTTIMQSRLMPGVYTRRQANGHLETQFNVKPGTGIGFRVGFEPDTAQYRVKISQANLHMYSLLHDLGVPDEELMKKWGPAIFNANREKYDSRVLGKAYDRLVPKRARKADAPTEEKIKLVREAFDKATIAGYVANRNLPGMLGEKFASAERAKWAGREAAMIKMAEEIENMPFEPDYTFDALTKSASLVGSENKLPSLLQAKDHSDKKQYGAKNRIMALMMYKAPDEFLVDSDDGKFLGITHSPTGFRMHLPKNIVPAAIRANVAGSKTASIHEDFMPDYAPDDLRESYNSIYGHVGPRLASMQAWPSDWLDDTDPGGWLQWYEQYSAGRRGETDDRQIKRWKSFKARHGSQLQKNPTPRRAFALRNWAIDPLKMIKDKDVREELEAAMNEYKDKAEKEYAEKKAAFDREELAAIATWLNNHHGAGIPTGTPDTQNLEDNIMDFVTNGMGAVNPSVMQAGVDGLARAEEAVEGIAKEAGIKPQAVLDAIRSGNFELLRTLGQAGGRASAAVRKVPELPQPQKLDAEFLAKKWPEHVSNPEVQHFLSVKDANIHQGLTSSK
jgi:hypothetical protein